MVECEGVCVEWWKVHVDGVSAEPADGEFGVCFEFFALLFALLFEAPVCFWSGVAVLSHLLSRGFGCRGSRRGRRGVFPRRRIVRVPIFFGGFGVLRLW